MNIRGQLAELAHEQSSCILIRFVTGRSVLYDDQSANRLIELSAEAIMTV
jgi:hypothetical protein